MNLDEIDVREHIMEIDFILNSDEKKEDIEYFIELKNWTETDMDLILNFTNPLVISRGFRSDQLVCVIKNKELFISQETKQRLT